GLAPDLVPDTVAIDGAHDARLHVDAAVRDRADRGNHLQRRHRHLIAHRYRRERAVGPLLRLPDDAGVLCREIRRDLLAEAVLRDEAAESLGADAEADLHRPDVARF